MTTCAHCRSPIRGGASIDSASVCHPDLGIDCYRLATVYGHRLPCQPCADARLLLDNDLRRAGALAPVLLNDWIVDVAADDPTVAVTGPMRVRASLRAVRGTEAEG